MKYNLTPEVSDTLKILWKRGSSFTLFLDFYIKTGTKISLWDKRLFEMSEVEITRVEIGNATATKHSPPPPPGTALGLNDTSQSACQKKQTKNNCNRKPALELSSVQFWPFWKGAYSKKGEFAPKFAKPFSQSPPLKRYRFPFRPADQDRYFCK